MTTERDIRNQIAYAHDKGVEEGIEQGIERGIEQGFERGIQSERSRIEENLRKKGMSDEEIAKLLEN